MKLNGMLQYLKKNCFHGYSFFSDADNEDSNKVFTRSAKAKQIARARELGHLQASDLDLHASGNGDGGDGLQEGGLALGLGSSSVSPARFSVAPSRISYEDRTVINANTRNIAALAARKRNKAGLGSLLAPRPLYRPHDEDDFDDFGDVVLTPSRLAQHNRYMEWGVAAGGTDSQFEDGGIESSLPPLRTIGTVGSRRLQEQEEARRRAVRYTGPSGGGNSNGGNYSSGAGGYLEVRKSPQLGIWFREALPAMGLEKVHRWYYVNRGLLNSSI